MMVATSSVSAWQRWRICEANYFTGEDALSRFICSDRLPLRWDTSCPRYGLKEKAFVSSEAAKLSYESGGRYALRVGCNLFAIKSVTHFVRKREHCDGDVGWAIVAEAREARTYFVWISSRDEISMMDSTVPFDERHPGACVGFKRAKLSKIERVPNLTCHWLTVGHCFPPYAFKSGIGNEKAPISSKFDRPRPISQRITSPRIEAIP
jgi:hypothetical protein